MFNKYYALALASLVGLGALAMPATTASAASLPYVQQDLLGKTAGNQNLLQQVDRRRGGHHRGGHHGGGHRRGHGGGHGFNNFGLFFSPFAFDSGYGYGYPYSYRQSRFYGGSSAHVRWCHSRYRSYNPWNNTWFSYSGRVRQCRSPYRYY